MVQQDPFHPGTTNPGRYAQLPDSGEDSDAASRRPSRTCHRVFVAALFVCGLVLVFLGFRNFTGGGSNDSGDDDIDCLTTPSAKPADFRAFSRGPADGVSEKANLLLAGDLPVCTWNNSVLAWERTAFHFQPENNWMNDPNGPLYYNGWYHLFYQYYPSAAVWGSPIVWGHAVSRDLINWLHLPLAMVSDEWYDARGVWSGSATVLPTGEIVMLYTGSTNESVQVQNLAYPVDLSDPLLLEWAKYSGNPILYPPPGIDDKDFRDPTTAWQASNGKWRITIGSKVNRTGISFVYETTDFKSYDRLDGILHGVPTTGMWECVDFYPVSTSEDVGLDTSVNGPDVKHVVKASLDDTRHDYYALGSYFEKNDTWIPDIPQIDVGIGIRYDYGVYYASKSFYDPKTQRRILWSWIGESDSEAADIKKGWASLQGLPRTVVLDRKTKSNLLQWPVKEVESLRMEKLEFKDIELHPGSTEALDVSPATQVDIEAVFEVEGGAVEKAGAETKENFGCSSGGGAGRRGALGPFGVVVLADKRGREQTPIYFYIAKEEGGKLNTFFCSDHTRSSLAADVKKDIYGNFVPVLDDENLSMRVLVDHTIVESFAQGGRTCITSRVYPTRAVLGAARILVFNNATDTAVKASLNVWHMNAADIRVYNPSTRRRTNHHYHYH